MLSNVRLGPVRILLRAVLAYAVAFGVWLWLAGPYHLFLARTAGLVLPILTDAAVERVWIEDRDDSDGGVGAHFQVVFKGHDPEVGLGRLRTLEARTVTIVDIRQFGYPILTFVALAAALYRRGMIGYLPRAAGGLGVVILIFAIWVAIEVCMYVAGQDLTFLRGNAVARLIPPETYARHRVGLIVYFGQLLPVGIFAAFCLPRIIAPSGRRRAG